MNSDFREVSYSEMLNYVLFKDLRLVFIFQISFAMFISKLVFSLIKKSLSKKCLLIFYPIYIFILHEAYNVLLL